MIDDGVDMKFVVTLALAISAIAISLHLSRPEASLRGWGWLLLIPAGILALEIGGELLMPRLTQALRHVSGCILWW